MAAPLLVELTLLNSLVLLSLIFSVCDWRSAHIEDKGTVPLCTQFMDQMNSAPIHIHSGFILWLITVIRQTAPPRFKHGSALGALIHTDILVPEFARSHRNDRTLRRHLWLCSLAILAPRGGTVPAHQC